MSAETKVPPVPSDRIAGFEHIPDADTFFDFSDLGAVDAVIPGVATPPTGDVPTLEMPVIASPEPTTPVTAIEADEVQPARPEPQPRYKDRIRRKSWQELLKAEEKKVRRQEVRREAKVQPDEPRLYDGLGRMAVASVTAPVKLIGRGMDSRSEKKEAEERREASAEKALGGLVALGEVVDRRDHIQTTNERIDELRGRVEQLAKSAHELTTSKGTGYNGVKAAIKSHKSELVAAKISDLEEVKEQLEQGKQGAKLPVRQRLQRRAKHTGESLVLRGAQVYESASDAFTKTLSWRATSLQNRANTKVKPIALFGPKYDTSLKTAAVQSRAEELAKRVADRQRRALERRKRLYDPILPATVSPTVKKSPWDAPDAASRHTASPATKSAAKPVWGPPIAPVTVPPKSPATTPPAPKNTVAAHNAAPSPTPAIEEHDPAVRVKLNLIVGRMTAPDSLEQREWARRKKDFLDQGGEESSPEFQQLRDSWSREIHQRALDEVSQSSRQS
jgi:hypothetical protein